MKKINKKKLRVINKNSMGYEFNKKERKKLIYLYKQFLEDPEKKYMEEGSWYFVQGDDFFYTKPVEIAMNASLKIYQGKMTNKRAKEILNNLLKEEKEEEEFEKLEGNK